MLADIYITRLHGVGVGGAGGVGGGGGSCADATGESALKVNYGRTAPGTRTRIHIPPGFSVGRFTNRPVTSSFEKRLNDSMFEI